MSNAWDKFDAWLTTNPDDNEDPYMDEKISDRTREYMTEGSLYDPFNWENFSNVIFDAKQIDVDCILDIAKNKEFLALGRYIYLMVMDEMEKEAENQASEDFNAGLIGNDYE